MGVSIDWCILSFQRAGALVSDFHGAKRIRVDSVCYPLPEFSYVLQLEALRLKIYFINELKSPTLQNSV